MMRRFVSASPLAMSVAKRCPPSAATAAVGAALFTPHMCSSSKTPKFTPPATPQPLNLSSSDCFSDRSVMYLLKSLFILKMCSIEAISKNCVAICKASERIFGNKLTYFVVKHTFYSFFCAGENDAELKASIKQLDRKNIGAVLDYAAEADEEGFTPVPGAEEAPDVSLSSLVTKTNIVYTGDEDAFDDNMKLYMMSTMHSAIHCPKGGQGLIAVKVSGMCEAKLLARVSAILLSIHQSWSKYFTEGQVPKLEECRVIMQVDEKDRTRISLADMEKGFMRYYPNDKLSPQGIKDILALLDKDGDGSVDYYTYVEVMSAALTSLNPSPVEQELVNRLPQLSPTEKKLWRDVYGRLRRIAATAANVNVRVMIDAEQTFYQPAIDAITVGLQREFNLKEPIVQNTYQCYLTYARSRVYADLLHARKHGYLWGGKIVRGAYIIQERKTASEYGYADPICADIEATGKNYELTASRIFREMAEHPERKIEAFFGTHNKQSVEFLAGEVLKMPEERQKRVFFGQLLGMRDNLTIPLARSGYRVYKYVPYGPVRETIYYLGRRAVENSSILKSPDSSDETRFMKEELLRRFGLKK